LIYVAAALGVVHFWWRVKSDVREPAIFAAVLTVLLAIRAVGAKLSAPRPRQPTA
jgi:methionine sulfoxide reductase heme-binding subunit